MKRVFSITVSNVGNVSPLNKSVRQYNVIAPNAMDAIRKATKQFKKEEHWAASVVVEKLEHIGPAI